MSLTRLIKSNSEEGIMLKHIISLAGVNTNEISKDILNSEMKAKYLLTDYKLASQLGAAFDYLARFVLKHYQVKTGGTATNDKYVAEHGLNGLLFYTKKEKNNYKKVYNTGLDIITDYINGDDSPQTFKRLIGVSVYFAKLESIYRSGYSDLKEFSLTKKIDPLVEQELINQIEIFIDTFDEKFNIKTKPNTIHYNPTFGKCSVAVGGADADVIINDTLIDFKSSKYLRSIDEDYIQLVGYYLFSRVINAPTKINNICLYFSRYGKFVEYKFTEKDLSNIESATREMDYFIQELI